jgi:3-hydroxy acid dehydrogenase / malonic semialdehyde reductase
MNPEAIADAVYWIATRPKNININRMEIMAGDQAFNPFNVVKKV